jgi:hypothetical protein
MNQTIINSELEGVYIDKTDCSSPVVSSRCIMCSTSYNDYSSSQLCQSCKEATMQAFDDDASDEFVVDDNNTPRNVFEQNNETTNCRSTEATLSSQQNNIDKKSIEDYQNKAIITPSPSQKESPTVSEYSETGLRPSNLNNSFALYTDEHAEYEVEEGYKKMHQDMFGSIDIKSTQDVQEIAPCTGYCTDCGIRFPPVERWKSRCMFCFRRHMRRTEALEKNKIVEAGSSSSAVKRKRNQDTSQTSAGTCTVCTKPTTNVKFEYCLVCYKDQKWIQEMQSKPPQLSHKVELTPAQLKLPRSLRVKHRQLFVCVDCGTIIPERWMTQCRPCYKKAPLPRLLSNSHHTAAATVNTSNSRKTKR